MAIRWLWWRVNAWSEVIGLGGSIVFSLATWWLPWTRHWWAPETMEEYFGQRTVFIMVATLVAWVIVTLLTKPVPEEVLDRFYQRVKPPGWWRPVRQRLGVEPSVGFPKILTCWSVMAVGIYAPLFGLLKLSLGDTRIGLPATVIGCVAIAAAISMARAMYGKESAEEQRVAQETR
jgi:hypothetical protein